MMDILKENGKLLAGAGVVAIFAIVALVGKLKPRQWREMTPYLIGGAAFLVFLLLLAGVLLILKKKAQARKRAAINQAVAEGETWTLLRPKEAKPVDIEKLSIWKRLAYAQPTAEHFSFEVFGNSEKQQIGIHASQTKLRSVLREITQEWSDIQRRPVDSASDPAVVPDGWSAHWFEVGPASPDQPVSAASRDPLFAVLSEIADLPAPTRGLLQVIVRSDMSTRRRLGQQSAAMRSGQVQDAGVRYQRTKAAKVLEDRGSQMFLQVTVRVAAISPDADRAQGAAMALANTLCNQFGPDNPVVILAQANPKKSNPAILAARAIEGATRSWADNELVALAHLPGGDAVKVAPMLSTGSAKFLPAAPELVITKNVRAPRVAIKA